MTDDITLTPDDIARDLDANRAAQSRLAEFFARDIPTPPVVRSSTGVGRLLIGRCPSATQKRYHTLLHFETFAEDNDDHGLLIAPACAVLEGELRRLVADPALASAELLATL